MYVELYWTLPHTLPCLRMYSLSWLAFGQRNRSIQRAFANRKKNVFFRWKLHESSTKAGWLSLKAPQKHDDFRWQLYKSRVTFVESSTKAGWLSLKALQKQDDFHWKLYENRMTLVESSMKAGWLSLKALRKKDGFCWELYERRMAFVESST